MAYYNNGSNPLLVRTIMMGLYQPALDSGGTPINNQPAPWDEPTPEERRRLVAPFLDSPRKRYLEDAR